MANQRMYIRCTDCGKEFSIAKRMAVGYYAHPWATENPEKWFSDMNEFFDEHQWCEGMPDNFELSWEVGQEHYGGEQNAST